jgi:hypothetical protein
VVDHGIVGTLTDANPCLAKQLEESDQELKEIRALLKKERALCANMLCLPLETTVVNMDTGL